LHEAVVGDDDARPRCLRQFVLGDDTPGLLGQTLQHGEGLGAQRHTSATGRAQFVLPQSTTNPSSSIASALSA
jgi:hypothetical protein